MEDESILLLLMLAIVSTSQEETCKGPYDPICFRRASKAIDVTCEWRPSESIENAIYTLFVWYTNISGVMYWEPPSRFKADGQSHTHVVPDHFLINRRKVDIWVIAEMDNSSCRSQNTSLTLNETVKYAAPKDISMSWSSSSLNLSWKSVENKGAKIEVLIRKLEDGTLGIWKNRTSETKPTTDTATVIMENLQNQSMYQVQVRQRSNQVKNPLWSDWTPILNIPAEIQNPPEVKWRVEDFNNGIRLLKLTWDAPPYPFSVEGVNYNLSLHIWPCQAKRKEVTIINSTEFSINVTYSAVNISIVAINKVGKSPKKHLLVTAKHQKTCPHTKLAPFKSKHAKTCLEWYKLEDGETQTQPATMKFSNTALNSIKKEMDDHVLYYYLVHNYSNGEPQTTEMCPIYKKEGKPNKKPQDFRTRDLTDNSVKLYWKPIPVSNQQGFLTHYEVCITKKKINDEAYKEKECHNVSTSHTQYLLQNLAPESIYEICLAGVTVAGSGPNATVKIETHSQPINVWMIVGSMVAVFFFTMICSIMIKRFKRKFFPPIPSPVIVDVTYQPRNENMLEIKEEVHELTLQQLHDKGIQALNQEEGTTLLEVCETNKGEDADQGSVDDSDTPDGVCAPLSPDYKGQMIRHSGSLETTDPSHGGHYVDVQERSGLRHEDRLYGGCGDTIVDATDVS